MNVGTLLERNSRAHGGKTALSFGEFTSTYEEFDNRVNSLANALIDNGIRKGDRVALIQNNSHQLIESVFCCFRAGFVAVPINARLSRNEFNFIIGNSEASAVILGEEFSDVANDPPSDVISTAERRSLFIITTGGQNSRALSYERPLAENPPKKPDAEVGLDDLAWLFYTSGTTGRPKGASLSHRNLLAMTLSFLADICPCAPSDTALHAAPLTHGSGL